MHVGIGADHGECVPEFSPDDARDILGTGDVMEGTTAGIRQRPEQ